MLLTAVPCTDYVDNQDPANENLFKTFNKEDFGYWVELEYGQWSDGYTWRTPYENRLYDYNTNQLGEIEEEDKGFYSFGRKQVYYLDRITTRNKTALFVKDMRYDSVGKDLEFKFSNDNEISIILQKKDLVVAKTELDITDEVIKTINTNIKQFKIK